MNVTMDAFRRVGTEGVKMKIDLRCAALKVAGAVSIALTAVAFIGLEHVLAVPPINANSGIAIKGYDPVAYFTAGKPIQGEIKHSHDWMGAKWQFSSDDHKQTFITNPEKYARRYGSYCAYAVSQGITADIDPEAWKIVDGRLYLNLSPGVADIWYKDIPGYIALANENWPKLRD